MSPIISKKSDKMLNDFFGFNVAWEKQKRTLRMCTTTNSSRPCHNKLHGQSHALPPVPILCWKQGHCRTDNCKCSATKKIVIWHVPCKNVSVHDLWLWNDFVDISTHVQDRYISLKARFCVDFKYSTVRGTNKNVGNKRRKKSTDNRVKTDKKPERK